VTTTTTVASSTTTTTAAIELRPHPHVHAGAPDDVTDPINPNGRRLNFRSSTKRDAARERHRRTARGTPAGDPTIGWGPDHRLQLRPASRRTASRRRCRPRDGPSSARRRSRRGTASHRSPARILRVTVKNHRVVIRGGKAAFGYTLNETAQGSVAIRLRSVRVPPGVRRPVAPRIPRRSTGPASSRQGRRRHRRPAPEPRASRPRRAGADTGGEPRTGPLSSWRR
jgi:hypothetical protein